MIKKNISLISDILNKPQATKESVKIQKHFCSLKDTQNDTENNTKFLQTTQKKANIDL